MNKFRTLTGDKPKPKAKAPPVVKQNSVEVNTSMGVLDYSATFVKGDVVKLRPENLKYSTSFKKIFNQRLLVDRCKVSDLGDMVEEILYLQPTIEGVENPYLVTHFKKVE